MATLLSILEGLHPDTLLFDRAVTWRVEVMLSEAWRELFAADANDYELRSLPDGRRAIAAKDDAEGEATYTERFDVPPETRVETVGERFARPASQPFPSQGGGDLPEPTEDEEVGGGEGISAEGTEEGEEEGDAERASLFDDVFDKLAIAVTSVLKDVPRSAANDIMVVHALVGLAAMFAEGRGVDFQEILRSHEDDDEPS